MLCDVPPPIIEVVDLPGNAAGSYTWGSDSIRIDIEHSNDQWVIEHETGHYYDAHCVHPDLREHWRPQLSHCPTWMDLTCDRADRPVEGFANAYAWHKTGLDPWQTVTDGWQVLIRWLFLRGTVK